MTKPSLADLRARLPLDRLTLDKLPRLGKPDLVRLQRRLQPRAALALTLEAGRILISAVRLPLDGDGRDVVPARPIPIGADEVFRNPEKAGAILAAALDAAGLREKRCAVCVPPAWALTASADLPPVEPDDLRGYLELRAEREFPVALSELRLAYSGYDLPEGGRRATLAALPTRRVEAVEAMLAAAGGRRAVSISLALANTLAGEERTPTLHFLSSSGHTDVVLTAGGGVAALRSLPGPAATATASAGDGPIGGLDGAAFDPGAFARDIRITLGRLPQSISQGARRARFGGNAEYAEALRTEIRESLGRMGIDAPAADLASPADETVRANATAENAAAARLRREAVPFEFVVPTPRRYEALFVRYNTQVYRRIAAVVACLIFLPLVMFFARSWYEGHLNSQWDGMRDNVADLDALQQKIRRFRPWFDPAPQTLGVLEGLFGIFPEGGDVWAKSIQVNAAGGVTCVGYARNQAALIAMTDRLRKQPGVSGVTLKGQRGENPIQFNLNCQWGTAR